MNQPRLPVLALPGLSPDSLGNYLASLGLLRVLSRKWPSTRIAWRDEVLQVIGGPTSIDELLDELVRIAIERAWTAYDRRWNEEQKKGTKTKSGLPLALWQASAEERELEVFAAHAVPHARVSFNPLFGSGGNAGKRAFSNGWAKAIEALAPPPPVTKEPKKDETDKQKAAREKRDKKAIDDYNQEAPARLKKNRDELKALLLGWPIAWLVEGLAAGSWFSEATKLYNSGQSPAREGQISPWAMVLACEGLAFLAGSASRRLGARSAGAVGAFPFVTQPIAASAEKEADRLRGEIWTPTWSRPTSLAEASSLFSRGRAELRGRGALTPAAFATAIRSRGVDGGVSEFRRFTLGRTTSSNTFEPRLEARFSLATGTDVGAAVSSALERITALVDQPGFPRDGKRFVGLRGPIEAALLDVAAEPTNPEAGIALLDAVFSALDSIDRNRSFREGKVRWEPLPLEWLPSLFADEPPSVEARLALSLVSGFPEALPFAAYRFGVHWTPERGGRYDYRWGIKPSYFEHTKVAPARWVWGPGQPQRVIANVLARRLLEGPTLDSPAAAQPPGRAPVPARADDVRAWFTGDLDEAVFLSWLSRFALFDWSGVVPTEVCGLGEYGANHHRADGDLALLGLLQPLVDQRPLVIRELSADDLLADKTGARTTEAARSLVTLTRAGNFDAVFRLASSRYAMAHARLAEFDVTFAADSPDRLAAALLFTLSDRDRAVLFKRWLRPRRRPQRGAAHV